MINVLERKGILTGKEVMDEMEVILATIYHQLPSCIALPEKQDF